MSNSTGRDLTFGPWHLRAGSWSSTMRQQLLWSHLRVTGLAAFVFAVAAFAIQSLTSPMATMQQVNVPSAHAAMLIQLGLQRSNAALHAWVALKNPQFLDNTSQAWAEEIQPAFDQLVQRSKQTTTPGREQTLDELSKKLQRLRKLQEWIADVAAKPGNEPARLVFSQELEPMQARVAEDLQKLALSARSRSRSRPVRPSDILKFQLAMSEVSAALGRFVVEGEEKDVEIYQQKIAEALDLLSLHTVNPATSHVSEDHLLALHNDLEIYQKLAESIIASRRSPRSNVAWNTIDIRERPLANEIAQILEQLSAEEVFMMRERVSQIVGWTKALAAGSALALVLMIIIAIVLSNNEAKRISAPISRLCGAAERVGKGQFLDALPEEGVSEVRRLIQGFNKMRVSISQSHDELERMAFKDELTGLANRKGFNSQIDSLSAQSNRIRQYRGIILIDLDRFKQVNDSLGHDAGDFLLKEFSDRLQKCLRPGDQAARFGGGEFAVVLETLSDVGDVETIVHRIQSYISQPLFYDGQKIIPSATLGIAVSSLEELDFKQLLINADQALYEAKAFRRGSYRFYSAAMHHKAQRSRRMLELIEHGDPGEVFSIVYQPYVNLTNRQIAGVEATLRWTHDECVSVTALEFTELLERSGHLERVTKWLLMEATNELARWRLPSGNQELSISFDIPASMLHAQNLAPLINEVVQRCKVSPSQLILEVSEAAVMEDYPSSLASMKRLDEMGVHFALDGFGTGYSSLFRLIEMPLGFLKIDRSIISHALQNEDDAVIVEASIQLGRTLGAQVTAVGLDEAHQVERLEALGCNIGQGSYFSDPITANDINDLITSHSESFSPKLIRTNHFAEFSASEQTG